MEGFLTLSHYPCYASWSNFGWSFAFAMPCIVRNSLARGLIGAQDGAVSQAIKPLYVPLVSALPHHPSSRSVTTTALAISFQIKTFTTHYTPSLFSNHNHNNHLQSITMHFLAAVTLLASVATALPTTSVTSETSNLARRDLINLRCLDPPYSAPQNFQSNATAVIAFLQTAPANVICESTTSADPNSNVFTETIGKVTFKVQNNSGAPHCNQGVTMAGFANTLAGYAAANCHGQGAAGLDTVFAGQEYEFYSTA